MMLKKYKVWVVDGDESDAISIESSDPKRAVNQACRWFWDEADGREWMKDGCKFVCKSPDETLQTFQITIEFEPSFFASFA